MCSPITYVTLRCSDKTGESKPVQLRQQVEVMWVQNRWFILQFFFFLIFTMVKHCLQCIIHFLLVQVYFLCSWVNLMYLPLLCQCLLSSLKLLDIIHQKFLFWCRTGDKEPNLCCRCRDSGVKVTLICLTSEILESNQSPHLKCIKNKPQICRKIWRKNIMVLELSYKTSYFIKSYWQVCLCITCTISVDSYINNEGLPELKRLTLVEMSTRSH